MMIYALDRVKNNVGKGENAAYQHFLLFLQCLKKVAFSALKWELCVTALKDIHFITLQQLKPNGCFFLDT